MNPCGARRRGVPLPLRTDLAVVALTKSSVASNHIDRSGSILLVLVTKHCQHLSRASSASTRPTVSLVPSATPSTYGLWPRPFQSRVV